MHGVRFVNPIADIQRTIRSDGDRNRPKIVAAGHQRRHLGPDGRTMLARREAIDAMVAPGCGQHLAAIFGRQIVRLISHDARRRFAGRRGHRQRARQFAVPSDERMQTGAAIAEAVSIIAARHDVQQAARRPRIGIVIDRTSAGRSCRSKCETDSKIPWRIARDGSRRPGNERYCPLRRRR